MNTFFSGKTVVITGASRGIGLSISNEFAREGANVVMAARSGEKLKIEADRLLAEGAEVSFKVTDVTSEESCKELISYCIKIYGKLDILINNAGISMRADFDRVDLSVLKRVMDVNFWGAVYCTKYALDELVKNRGAIVGVSSVAGFHGLPGRSGYSASKFAMHGFLETIRIENFMSGLQVMILAPGFTASGIRESALLADGSEQGKSPRKEDKMMTPEYAAKWVLRGIRKKKRNKILTWEGRLVAFFQRIVPWIVDWFIYREMKREPESPLQN